MNEKEQKLTNEILDVLNRLEEGVKDIKKDVSDLKDGAKEINHIIDRINKSLTVKN